jgi:hypothetical protein
MSITPDNNTISNTTANNTITSNNTSNTPTNNTNFEDHFPDLGQENFEDNSSNDDSGLTLRALVSTKEAGVIIGKGL